MIESTAEVKVKKFSIDFTLVGYILGIITFVVLFFGGCERAKAEEMNPSLQEIVIDYFDEYFIGYDLNTLNQIMSECPYVTIYQWTNHSDGNNSFYVAEFWSVEDCGFMYSTSSSSFYGQTTSQSVIFAPNDSNWRYGILVTSHTNNEPFTKPIKAYRAISRVNNKNLINIGVRSVNEYFTPVLNSSVYYLTISQGNNNALEIIQGSNNNLYYNSSYTSGNCILNYGNILIQKERGNPYLSNYQIFEDTWEPPVQTEGLKVYKRTLQNQNSLVVDFSDLISISQAVSNTSTLAITINIDGTDTILNYDSNSDYYYYNTLLQKAYYQFSFNALGLTGDIDYAYVSNVTLTNTVTSPGGSSTETFYYLDPVALIGEPPRTGYEDTEIEQFENEEIISDIEMTTLNEYIINSNSMTASFDDNGNGFEFLYEMFPYTSYASLNIPSWANTYQLQVYEFGDVHTSGQIDFYGEDGTYYKNYKSDLAPYLTEQVDLYSFLMTLINTDYYDVIVVRVDLVNKGSGLNHNHPRYGAFVTNRYWNHYMSTNMLNILKYNKNIDTNLYLTYDYLKQRLDNMNSNMVEYFKTSSDKLNSIIGLLESINNALPDLNNLLNRILDALQNLNISSPDADLTPVTTSIDKIYQAMTNHSYNNTSLYGEFQRFLVEGDAPQWIRNSLDTFTAIFYSINSGQTDWNISKSDRQSLFDAVADFFDSLNWSTGDTADDFNFSLKPLYNPNDWNGGYR